MLPFKTHRRQRNEHRKLRVEALELRQLMANDLGLALSSHTPKIINGTRTSDFPSVGIVGDTSGGFCTGTLISSRHVLTAAHCTDGVTNTSGRVTFGSSTYSTNRVINHPDYNEAQFGTDAANDIAIFQLTTEVVGIAPSPIFRSVPSVGSLLTLVGFGGGGTGDTGSDGSFGTKRFGTTPIDAVSSTLIHWTFQGASESNTAPGDSGGPSFLQVNGEYLVAGVTSGGTLASAGYGDESYNTRVDAYQSWIDAILNPAPTTNFIDYATAGSTHVESFSVLASSGTSETLPSGWAIHESGSASNTSYAASDGGASSGNTYSFGENGSGDRALGSLLSGSLIPTVGAAIKNNTGADLTSMNIGYIGEQWRLGANGRADRLDFQYSLNATGLSDGTWIDVNSLDFSSPITSGTVGKLNGNAAPNRTSVSGSISGLEIPAGSTFWVRWVDFNASGADDGLAIEDFTFSAIGSSGSGTNTAPVIATNLGLTVLSGSAANVIDTDRLAAIDAQQSASQLTFVATSLPEFGTLRLDGAPIAVNTTTWTQADIDAGLLTYDAPDLIDTTGFTFEVSDGLLSTTASFVLTISSPGNSSNAVEYTSLGAPYSQDFNSLAATGTSTSLPTGWLFVESGNGANTTYSAGTGTANVGDTYNFGATSAIDRAFGSLRSGSVVPTIGVAIRNGSGSAITSITTSYTGEQWRLGSLGRVDRLDFQYSLNASSLSDGDWIDVDLLDFVSPQMTGTVGALDGNSPTNRATIGSTIDEVNLPNGSTIWFRWNDFNATGPDDGLAIDNFSFSATSETATNNPPTAVSLSESSMTISEDTSTATAIKVADITITDDGLGTNGLLLSGADADSFSIVGNELFLRAGVTLNATSKPSYSVTIDVDDVSVGSTPDASTSFALNISARNSENSPPSISNQSFTINAKAIYGSIVGNVVATDSDAGQSLTFSIPTGSAFDIDADTGVLRVINTSLLPSVKVSTPMQVLVTVTDSGTPALSRTATITVNRVPGAPMAPLAVTGPNLVVAENNKDGAKVGRVVPVASYSGQKFRFLPLASSGDAANFMVDTVRGGITVKPGVRLDHEAQASYRFDVTVVDSLDATKATTAEVTVLVLNRNEAPTYSLIDRGATPVEITKGAAELTLPESIPGNASKNGLVVATLTALDQDQVASTLKYQVNNKGSSVVLDKTGAFGYDQANGQISIVDETKVDFEKYKSIKLSFVVTDNPIAGDLKSKAISVKLSVTIRLEDQNEAPIISSPSSFTVTENNKAGLKVGVVKAKDADSKAAVKQTLIYAIDSQRDASGNDVAIFAIDPSMGGITIPTAAALDFESSPTYTLVVRVSDNGSPELFTLQTITVNVLDANETARFTFRDRDDLVTFAPLSQSLATATNGMKLGSLAIADTDAGAAGTYSLASARAALLAASKGALSLVEVPGETNLWDIVLQDRTKLKLGMLNMKLTLQDASAKPLKSTASLTLNVLA